MQGVKDRKVVNVDTTILFTGDIRHIRRKVRRVRVGTRDTCSLADTTGRTRAAGLRTVTLEEAGAIFGLPEWDVVGTRGLDVSGKLGVDY